EVDKNGRRWFATDDGVSSFDGINWTCYTGDNGLASNGVTSIAVEPDGTLWFGTGEAGVSRLSFE
ncbi:MAG TPA: two-component regulator propeller domain-containing protein, partial [Bacteroidales bacterium]|nr:two-component regulator propeller domain-containing protein [Bacteroidales bacterium]